MKLNLPKKELQILGISFLIVILLFKIVFYKESFTILFKLTFGLFWLLVLPGYALMLFWKEKLSFPIRILIGMAVATALTGSISYYLGILGLNLKIQVYFLPIALIILGGYVYYHNEQRRIRSD